MSPRTELLQILRLDSEWLSITSAKNAGLSEFGRRWSWVDLICIQISSADYDCVNKNLHMGGRKGKIGSILAICRVELGRVAIGYANAFSRRNRYFRHLSTPCTRPRVDRNVGLFNDY